MGTHRRFRLKLLGADYKTKVDFIFRGANRGEMRRFEELSETSVYAAEHFLLKKCCEVDTEWDVFPAGSASILIEQILKNSCTVESGYFDKAIKYFSTELGLMEAKACCVIPGLTFEHLDNCDPEYYAKYIVFGQNMFNAVYGDGSQAPVQHGTTVQENLPSKPGEVGVRTETTSLRAGR